MGFGMFLQNYETRHKQKQKWALANYFESLRTSKHNRYLKKYVETPMRRCVVKKLFCSKMQA